MFDLNRIRQNPVSAVVLGLCILQEINFYRAYTGGITAGGTILQTLGAGRSGAGAFITSLAPMLSFFLILMAVGLIYKEFKMQDDKRKLIFNGIACIVVILLPIFFQIEVNSEIQQVLHQLGR